jgi:hypothetical protein
MVGVPDDGGNGHEPDCDTANEEQAHQPIKYQRANETKRAKREAAMNERLKPRTLPRDYFGAKEWRWPKIDTAIREVLPDKT